ncbi:muscle-specific protein 20-like [Clytia hemisphaerica]|uniref:Calponin-homology (CH) domain-containing protein n=1 Tax=Clytia hemisphaerica TaxID=252671 RepID=A0A7M5VGP2_9CNID
MADRQEGYGFTKELHDKMAFKYDIDQEQEAIEWIMHHVKDCDLEDVRGAESLQAKLKDGKILCQLINAIEPGSVKKINESEIAFKQMENIDNFLKACENYGCKKVDLFQTVSLYDGINMAEVLTTLFALGRKVSQKGKRGIGPKESEENKRNFTEEQLREGNSHIGLQAGWNKGASQAGQNFGKTRAILD